MSRPFLLGGRLEGAFRSVKQAENDGDKCKV